MRVVKVIELRILDSEIEIYEAQKARFVKETGESISDEQYVRTFIYQDVCEKMREI